MYFEHAQEYFFYVPPCFLSHRRTRATISTQVSLRRKKKNAAGIYNHHRNNPVVYQYTGGAGIKGVPKETQRLQRSISADDVNIMYTQFY